MGKISRILAAGLCLLWMGAAMTTSTTKTRTYAADDSAFPNAQIGYAPMIDTAEAGDAALRYLELTWREAEPEEGVYAWEAISEKYDFASLREQGIHLVLRFVCDVPGQETHLDIPDWLYAQTKDGSWYDTDYGKGYSPNYANVVFRAAHHRVLYALAEFLGTDGFASYVELGSLGHWGEWHIKSEDGLVSMPDETIRDEYAADYLAAFPTAKLLMRRPFRAAKQYGMGLYNDMAGHARDTEEWLQWIREGGDYAQAEEEDALSSMPDFWKTAPSGGELTSSVSMEELLQTNLDETVQLLRDSHTTFLGPKIADEAYPEGYEAVLHQMGYRIRILEAELGEAGEQESSIRLTWENDGVAPFYGDWPVYVYVEDGNGETVEKEPVTMQLPALLPGVQMVTDTALATKDLPELAGNEGIYQIWIGAEDPMTGRPAVRLAMDVEYVDGRNRLF